MTKQEILIVVEQMLADWQTAYDSKDVDVVFKLNCEFGFCSWMFFNHNVQRPFIKELAKEVTIKSDFWYTTFWKKRNFSVLLPRINHLQRTIARLKNEIELETKTQAS